jgi:hypothetical protein
MTMYSFASKQSVSWLLNVRQEYELKILEKKELKKMN